MAMKKAITTKNFETAQAIWKDVPNLLNELENYKKMPNNAQLILSKINESYEGLADACEKMSDQLFDELNEKSKEEDIVLVKTLMLHSIEYTQKANLAVKIDLHISYLNLLEKSYQISKNAAYIAEIAQYIENTQLITLPLEPIELVQIYNFQLFVAIENDTVLIAKDIIEKIKNIAKKVDKESAEIIIADIQKLADKLNHKLPLKKRARESIDSYFELEEVISDIEEVSNIEASYTEITSNRKDDEKEGISGIEEISNIEASYTEATSNRKDDEEEVSIQKTKRVKLWKLDDSLEEEELAKESNLSFLDSDVCASSSSEIVYTPNTHTPSVNSLNRFFTKKQVYFQEISHIEAFSIALNAIGRKSENNKFLAKLLSLVADFYYGYNQRNNGLPAITNTVLLAYDLYKSALLLYPEHRIAQDQIRKLDKDRKIQDYNSFKRILSPSTKSSNEIFSDALKEVTTQLEAYLSENKAQINVVLDHCINYLSKKIPNIVESKGLEISEKLKARYQHATSHEAVSGFQSTSSLI